MLARRPPDGWVTLFLLAAAATSLVTNQPAVAAGLASEADMDVHISGAFDGSGSHVAVPPSFLGISHEPITMAKEVVLTPHYLGFIELLSSFDTGPFVLRWGGNEQDKLEEPVEDAHWRSLAELHEKTGVRYMFGLNLMARDPDLAVQQITNAMRFLPPQSVMSFGLGNEPDVYRFRGNKTLFQEDYWRQGWFDDITAYCTALAPVLEEHFKTTKMISGPGSADMLMWRDTQAKKFAGTPPLKAFVTLLTVHFYTYRATLPSASYLTFLSEGKLDLVRGCDPGCDGPGPLGSSSV